MNLIKHPEDYQGLSLLAHRMAWKVLANEYRSLDPEEFHAEAMLGLCIALETFDPAMQIPLGGYTTTVVRRRLNEFLRRLRKQRRIRILPMADFGQMTVPCRKTREPAEIISTKELLAKVRIVLPPRLFEVLSLYYIEGYTYEEIGQRFGLTRQWAHLRIERAIRIARAALPQYVECN